jgi:hypothetical protein
MKNNLKRFLLGSLTIVGMTLGAVTVRSAEAKIVRITGEGSGGTTHGDREAACDRAYDRATDDAENQCFNRDGDVLGSERNSCSCRKKPGSRDDYNCEATVRLNCDVACRPNVINLQAEGLGIDFNRNQACNDASRRAQDDTSYQCSRRDGFIRSNEELSCNCRRLNGGDYECRANVRSECEVNSCQ